MSYSREEPVFDYCAEQCFEAFDRMMSAVVGVSKPHKPYADRFVWLSFYSGGDWWVGLRATKDKSPVGAWLFIYNVPFKNETMAKISASVFQAMLSYLDVCNMDAEGEGD